MDIRNYALVTASYWGFTLTDGALRMLVLLHFHQLGYTPVNLAFLFLLYEFFGILNKSVRRLDRFPIRFAADAVRWPSDSSGRAGHAVAGGYGLGRLDIRELRYDGPSTVRHRQRLDENEFQERDQALDSRGERFGVVQVGRHPHRLQERTQRTWVPHRRRAAKLAWFCARTVGDGRCIGHGPRLLHAEPQARYGKVQDQGKIQATLLQESSH